MPSSHLNFIHSVRIHALNVFEDCDIDGKLIASTILSDRPSWHGLWMCQTIKRLPGLKRVLVDKADVRPDHKLCLELKREAERKIIGTTGREDIEVSLKGPNETDIVV